MENDDLQWIILIQDNTEEFNGNCDGDLKSITCRFSMVIENLKYKCN